MRATGIWFRLTLALALLLVGFATVSSLNPAPALGWDGSVGYSYDDTLVTGTPTTASPVDLRFQPIQTPSSDSGYFYDSSSYSVATKGADEVGDALGAFVKGPFDEAGDIKYLHGVDRAGDTYRRWDALTTDQVVTSLRPGGSDPLVFTDVGNIGRGNTRIALLEDRGYDVTGLLQDLWNDPFVPKNY